MRVDFVAPAMPYAISVDHESRDVTVVATEPVGLSDVLALLGRQIAEGAWGYRTLHDARQVGWVPTPDDMRVIVACVDTNSKTLGPRGPVAFVTRGSVSIGFARVYESMTDGSSLQGRVFGDLDAARRWLDEQGEP
jgi:hypothetical protein